MQIELANQRLETPSAVSMAVFWEHSGLTVVIFTIVLVAVLFIGNAVLAEDIPMVGSCTPGEVQCQVGELAQCGCYEDWRETPEGETMVFAVCEWESTGESCGNPVRPPDCTPNRRGVEAEFAGGAIKTCTCYGENQDNCLWE